MKHNSLLMGLVLFVYMADGYAIHDPTQPPAVILESMAKKADGAVKLNLQAVIGTKSGKVAIINGNRLKVGDKIEGSEIIEIGKTSVQIKKGALITTLSMTGR